MSGLVTVRKPKLPYVLLTPVDSRPNRKILITHWTEVASWTSWFDSVLESDVVSLDTETRGTNPADPESAIVGIGFSTGRSSLYIDVADILDCEDSYNILVEYIEQLPAVIGHNIYFDWGMLRAKWGCEPNWIACTYGLYRQLATEGFTGQRWGLKGAQEDLLGWGETNDVDLSQWLVDSGYRKGISVVERDGYYPYTNDEGELRYASPDKGEMWRAPREILGYYCALDCDSTWQLYTHVLLPALEEHQELARYHYEEYLTLVDIHVDQRFSGIRVNTTALREHSTRLRERMSELEGELRAHPVAGGYITQWESTKRLEHYEKEPKKMKKTKPVPTEPKKFRKDGEVSGNWIRWCENIQSGKYDPEISGNWLRWEERRVEIESGRVPEYCFNVASGVQLRWLLYEKLFHYEVITPHTEKDRGVVRIYRGKELGGPIDLDTTDSGLPPIDDKALMQLGEVGDILSRYSDASKELSYVESYLTISLPDGEVNDIQYGRLHPSFRLPGTLTGRLSSSEPNVQQIPGCRDVLDCFLPDPGYCFVQCDVNALENVVLAELSGDPALMELYGPGAAPHDSYLYNAAKMYEIAGVEIFREVAAEYRPDPDTVRELKKKYKGIRAISKKTTLSKNYGIGAEKLYKDLLLQGARVTRGDVAAIHAAYDEVYSGVSGWASELTEEWRVRRGWVLNGIGRPMGVSERKKKDLVNQVCQSTGHDILMRMIYHAKGLLDRDCPGWKPVIMSLHDETIIQVPERYKERALDILQREIYDLTNKELDGIIPLTGDGSIGNCLSDVKQPER